MQKYFFAESCLHVNDVTGIFDERLSPFCREAPFSNTIVLNTFLGVHPNLENVKIISTGSGIQIGTVKETKWYFSGINKSDLCCIEASNDYTQLNCYINQPSGSDKKV